MEISASWLFQGWGETTKLKLEGKVFVLFGKHYKARCYSQFPQGWQGWERTSHCNSTDNTHAWNPGWRQKVKLTKTHASSERCGSIDVCISLPQCHLSTVLGTGWIFHDVFRQRVSGQKTKLLKAKPVKYRCRAESGPEKLYKWSACK